MNFQYLHIHTLPCTKCNWSRNLCFSFWRSKESTFTASQLCTIVAHLTLPHVYTLSNLEPEMSLSLCDRWQIAHTRVTTWAVRGMEKTL